MLVQEFLDRATGKPILNSEFSHDDINYRQSILDLFEQIHEAVRCEHSPAEAWILADAILSENAAGPIVECGVFKGGMTTKLSHLCRSTGRELYVCDSFLGLLAG